MPRTVQARARRGDTQLVTIPVGGGLDNRTEPHLLQAPKGQFARNVTGRKVGAYLKVPGATLAGSPLVGDPGQLIRYRKQQLLALGRDGSAVFGGGTAWNAHPDAGEARPVTVEWVGALHVRGNVLSVNLAHNDGYTAVVAMIARDVTANASNDIDDDLEAACIILDSEDRVVWGPYYQRDIRLWPRVEPLTSGGNAGFVFMGLDEDLDLPHGNVADLNAFRVLSSSWSAPSSITIDTLQATTAGGGHRRFLYDTHGAGDTETAYLVYYSNVDASVVVKRVDGNVGWAAQILSVARDGNYAVWHDTSTSTVFVYCAKSASIYAASEDLTTINTHGSAGSFGTPVWYEHNGNLYMTGMLVTQSGTGPSTPTFSGSAAHVVQSLDMDPHQLGTNGPALFFHYPALWENGVADPVPIEYIELNATIGAGTAGSEKPYVVAPLLASRHNAQELLNVHDRGSSQYDFNMPQVDEDSTGRVYVPWAVLAPTAKPWEGMDDASNLIDRNEGGPYNADRVIGFCRIDYSDDVSKHSSFEHSGSMILAAGEVYGYDGGSFVDIPGPPRVSDYDDGASPSSYATRSDVHDFQQVTNWWALRLVLAYTDRNGIEYRSKPSDTWFQNGVANNTDCPRIDIEMREHHRRVLDAGGSFDVELYVTKRSDEATASSTPSTRNYSTTFLNPEDVTPQFYLAQRTPLQEDGSGFFIPDFLQNEYRGVYRPLSSTTSRVRPLRQAIPLYTDSGELAPIRPPASNIVAAAGGYGFLVPSEFPAELWPTKPLERGRAPEWHPQLIISAPAGAGEITGMASQGDRLILLCQFGVWELFVGGGGPDSSGTGGFSALRKIHDGDGCLGQHTVVSVPQGVFYVSDSGPKVVTANAVEDIGRVLTDLMVPSGVLDVAYHEKEDEIWVVMSDGNHFVYDLVSGIWTDNQLAAKSAAYHDQKLYRLANTGQVHEESDTSQDITTDILAQVTTGWINLGDLQGYRSLKRAAMLFRHIQGNVGSLSLKIAYDYNDTVVDTFTWLASDYTTHERLGHLVGRPSRRKASAVKLTFQEGLETVGQSDDNTVRWSFAGFQLEYAPKGGLIRLQQEAKK